MLTLDKAIHLAQNFEYCQQQMASMNIAGSAEQPAEDAVRCHKQSWGQRKMEKTPEDSSSTEEISQLW